MFEQSKPKSEPFHLSTESAHKGNTAGEKFDGEMMIVVGNTLDSRLKYPSTQVSFIEATKEQSVVLGPILLTFLAKLHDIQYLSSKPEQTKFDKIMIKQLLAEVNGLLEVFMETRAVNKRILEALIDGTNKVGLWVNSMGGEVDQADEINQAVAYLSDHDASVHAFGTYAIISAALDLFLTADQKYCLTRSPGIWHLSDSLDSPRVQKVAAIRSGQEVPSEVEEEVGDFIMSLLELAPEQKIVAMELFNKVFHDPANPDGSFQFDGATAEALGLVQAVYTPIERLIRRYEQTFPLHKRKPNIMFYTLEIAREVYKTLRHQPEWQGAEIRLTAKTERLFTQAGRAKLRKSNIPVPTSSEVRVRQAPGRYHTRSSRKK